MSNIRGWVRVGLFASLALAAGVACALGCRTRPQPTDLPKEVLAQKWIEPDVPPGTRYIETDKAMIEGLAIALNRDGPMPPAPARPLNLLALSAGGKYGAYTAGVLAGWQANGISAWAASGQVSAHMKACMQPIEVPITRRA